MQRPELLWSCSSCWRLDPSCSHCERNLAFAFLELLVKGYRTGGVRAPECSRDKVVLCVEHAAFWLHQRKTGTIRETPGRMMNAYALHVNVVRMQPERNSFCRYDGLSLGSLAPLIDIHAVTMCQLKFLAFPLTIKRSQTQHELRNKHKNTIRKTMRSFIDRRNIKYWSLNARISYVFQVSVTYYSMKFPRLAGRKLFYSDCFILLSCAIVALLNSETYMVYAFPRNKLFYTTVHCNIDLCIDSFLFIREKKFNSAIISNLYLRRLCIE